MPAEWNGFAYVYEGKGRIGDKAAQPENLYSFHNEGDTVRGREQLCLFACLLGLRAGRGGLWSCCSG